MILAKVQTSLNECFCDTMSIPCLFKALFLTMQILVGEITLKNTVSSCHRILEFSELLKAWTLQVFSKELFRLTLLYLYIFE